MQGFFLGKNLAYSAFAISVFICNANLTKKRSVASPLSFGLTLKHSVARYDIYFGDGAVYLPEWSGVDVFVIRELYLGAASL